MTSQAESTLKNVRLILCVIALGAVLVVMTKPQMYLDYGWFFVVLFVVGGLPGVIATAILKRRAWASRDTLRGSL